MLQLHIPPPLLTLPTFHAESLAALTYVQHKASGQFVAIYCYDVDSIPLLVDGGKRLRGFRQIARYLDDEWSGRQIRGVDEKVKREIFVITTHINVHAPPLIDTHLYTDPHNYHNHTLHAYRQTFPFPQRHTLSSIHHALALRRTAAAGLYSPTDPLSINEDPSAPQTDIQDRMARIASTSPSLLFRTRRPGALETLKTQHAEQTFRIEAHLKELLEPIADRLERNDGTLFHDERREWMVTSADCALFAQLAFLLYPAVEGTDVPRALAELFPRVVKYVDEIGESVFGLDFTDRSLRERVWDQNRMMGSPVFDPLGTPARMDDVPFPVATAPKAASILRSPRRLMATGLSTLFDRLNPLPHTYRALLIQQSRYDSSFPYLLGASVSALLAVVGGLTAGFLATGKNTELHKVFFREIAQGAKGSRLQGLGEAGAMLGSLSGFR